jgi:gas vesicle protein
VNSFLKGVLFGAGIGLLVAPMKGKEMRTLLAQRFEELRGYLPENEQLTQYRQQVSNRVSRTASNLRDYAQQAASSVRSSASNLSSIGQQTTADIKQTGYDVADMTKQAVQPGKAGTTVGNTGRTTITPEADTNR